MIAGNTLNSKTVSIVPADLNALVYWSAKKLSDFYRDMDVTVKTKEYENNAEQWKDGVTEVPTRSYGGHRLVAIIRYVK